MPRDSPGASSCQVKGCDVCSQSRSSRVSVLLRILSLQGEISLFVPTDFPCPYGFFLSLFSTPLYSLEMRLLVAVLYRMLHITEGRCKNNPAELPSCRWHEIWLMSLCPGLERSPLLVVCFLGPLLPRQVCAPGSGSGELTVPRTHSTCG